jgi:hypothetical protein
MNSKQRIAAIQASLGLHADGILGPVTLTAIERLLADRSIPVSQPPRLSCSLAGLKWIVNFEIGSEAYYNRRLKHPVWPGGASGVTIGVGYDLGYCSAAQMRRDWGGRIPDADLISLAKVCRLKGQEARAKVSLSAIKAVSVPLESARRVFYSASLPNYAAKCLKAYPGVEKLPADAQAALLSLVFNRGTAKSGSKRKEMKAIGSLVVDADLDGIADQIVSMKRLWEGRGLDGLLLRRDREAKLVRESRRDYEPAELVDI